MGIKFANKASTSLTSGINSSATSIDVADGSVFPTLGANDHFFATLQFLNDSSETEVIKVTAVSGNTLTVDRSIETSKSFSANDIIELRVTSQALADPTLLAEGVKLEDGHKIQLGDSDDLQIYHDGSDSFITDTGAGDLYIQGSEVTLKRGGATKLNTTLYGVQVSGRIDATDIDLSGTILSDAFKSDGESTDYNIFSRVNTTHPAIYVQSTGTKIASFATGSVLPNGGTEILDVNSTGIDVTGDVAATTVTVGDGTSTDLKLYKDGSNNCFIEQRGSGGLDVSGIYGKLSNESNQELISWDTDNAALSWRGASGAGLKLTTTETGINVTGTVTADGVSLEAGDKLIFGAEANSSLQIYEDDDGGKSRIAQYGGGDLWIQGENISLRNDDAETLIGTGHTQAFMYWQGDTGTKGERLRTTDSGIDVTGAITVSGNVDGRDIAADGLILDAIEAGADVTDTTNVVAALTAGTNIAIAGDGTISSTDTNTQYTGGTGLTLSDTTFNVDAAQTQITSVGTLTSLTTGDATINGSFTVNNILFTNTDLNATEFEAAQGKRIVRQSGTANKTFALFQPAAANVGQTWTILNSSSGTITLDVDSQYFHILDGVTTSGKQADWLIKKGGVADIMCIGSLDNGGSQFLPNFVIYGSGIVEI